jgi:hypothetical protein
MNKTNLLLSAFILSAVFLLGCSSDETGGGNDTSSSSIKSSSGSVNGSSSSRGGGGIPDQDLVRKDITLSSDKSYADLDGENPAAYTKEYAASNLDKIDIIAHCGTDSGYCERNSIYSPNSINLFYNLGNYIGGKNIILYEVPAAYADEFKTAEKLSDISQVLVDLINNGLVATNCRDCVSEIPIVEGKVFLVQTSGNKWRIVIIKATGNQSDLEVILIPGNDDAPSSSSAKPSSSSVKVSSSSSTITIDDPDLIKKTITLSFAGSSYADIDGNIATYKQAEAKSRLEKIDLIAYCGTDAGWCENNSIYTPWVIKLFWQSEYEFLGSEYVSFLKIPSEQAEVFKAATKRSEIRDAYNSLLPLFDVDENYLDEIPIVAGNVFFAVTSEGKAHIVVIKATGNQSVDLEVIQIP